MLVLHWFMSGSGQLSLGRGRVNKQPFCWRETLLSPQQGECIQVKVK